MSASHLPEDIAQWPRDPFALLGVERRADSKAIKRAYTQLLRHFKPERLPQHFQLLREAYEKAQALAQWQEQYGIEIHDDNDSRDAANLTAAGEADASTIDSAAPAEQPSPPPVYSSNEVGRAWQEATEGKSGEAYQRLVEWHAGGGEGRTTAETWQGYAQLYWLLTLYPDLSPDATTVDWLIQGLERSNGAWPLLELLRREFERDDSEAFRPAVDALLERLPPASVAQVLAMRWHARRQRREYSLILEELEQFRHKVTRDPSAWSSLLVSALEACVLGVPANDPALRHIAEELGACDFSRSFDWRLDRLDLFHHVDTVWTGLHSSNLPRSWLKLLCDYYSDDKAARTSLLEEITADIAKAPLQALHDFDSLIDHFPSASVLILEAIQNHYASRDDRQQDPWDAPNELPAPLAATLREHRNYEWTRTELVQWSLAEFVAPSAVAALILSDTGLDMSEEIGQDTSFHCVYSAWEAYWSLANTDNY